MFSSLLLRSSLRLSRVRVSAPLLLSLHQKRQQHSAEGYILLRQLLAAMKPIPFPRQGPLVFKPQPHYKGGITNPDPPTLYCFSCPPNKDGSPIPIGSSKDDVFTHHYIFHKFQSLRCGDCDSKFGTEEQLKQHKDSKVCLLWGPLKFPNGRLTTPYPTVHKMDWKAFQSIEKIEWFPSINQRNKFLFDLLMANKDGLIVVYVRFHAQLLAELLVKCTVKGVVYTTNSMDVKEWQFVFHKLRVGTCRILITEDLHAIRFTNIGKKVDIMVYYDMPEYFDDFVKNRMVTFGLPRKLYYFIPREELNQRVGVKASQ